MASASWSSSAKSKSTTPLPLYATTANCIALATTLPFMPAVRTMLAAMWRERSQPDSLLPPPLLHADLPDESDASSMKTTSARTEWYGIVVCVVVPVVVSHSSASAINDDTKVARLLNDTSPRCCRDGSDANKFKVPWSDESSLPLTSNAHLVTEGSFHAGWFNSACNRASADTGLPASVGLPLPSVSTTTWAGYSGRRAQSIAVVKVLFPAHSVRTACSATSKLVSEKTKRCSCSRSKRTCSVTPAASCRAE